MSIGSVATPPPGEYRFARIRADGTAEVRELLTANGPGPWLAYAGRAVVPTSDVHDALETLDRTPPEPLKNEGHAPCVLSFQSAAGSTWQGCGYPAVAARLLAHVPRLTLPDPSGTCIGQACQVRVLTQSPPTGHERFGRVRQDIVFDAGGAFWCARHDGQRNGQAIVLHVEHGRLAASGTATVFEWLIGSSDDLPAPSGERAAHGVMYRGRDRAWVAVSGRTAHVIARRWRHLAARLPAECRPD